jgi:hypothetical protein
MFSWSNLSGVATSPLLRRTKPPRFFTLFLSDWAPHQKKKKKKKKKN